MIKKLFGCFTILVLLAIALVLVVNIALTNFVKAHLAEQAPHAKIGAVRLGLNSIKLYDFAMENEGIKVYLTRLVVHFPFTCLPSWLDDSTKPTMPAYLHIDATNARYVTSDLSIFASAFQIDYQGNGKYLEDLYHNAWRINANVHNPQLVLMHSVLPVELLKASTLSLELSANPQNGGIARAQIDINQDIGKFKLTSRWDYRDAPQLIEASWQANINSHGKKLVFEETGLGIVIGKSTFSGQLIGIDKQYLASAALDMQDILVSTPQAAQTFTINTLKINAKYEDEYLAMPIINMQSTSGNIDGQVGMQIDNEESIQARFRLNNLDDGMFGLLSLFALQNNLELPYQARTYNLRVYGSRQYPRYSITSY